MATKFPEEEPSSPAYCSLLSNNHHGGNRHNRYFQSTQERPHNKMESQAAACNIAEELNKLSLKERTEITEEQHGVAMTVEETPQFIQKKLNDFRQYLSESIPPRQKKVWERAIFLRPSLLTDDAFHLMFLRGKKFDVAEAAVSCCTYFQNKLELFGDSLLVKRITIDCLTAHEIQLIKNGGLLFLPQSDSRGRGVLLWNIPQCDVRDKKAFTRMVWYITMTSILENEQMQINGFILIEILYGKYTQKTSDLVDFAWQTKHITQNWPYFVNCIHILYDQPMLNAFLQAINLAQNKELRIRQRYHYSSPQEAQYELLTFGIHLEGWLVTGTDNLSTKSLDQYVDARRETDAEWKAIEKKFELSTSQFAIYPNEQDVLMGRGKFRDWYGNIRLNRMIAQRYAKRYLEAESKDRIEKTILSMEVIQHVEEEYGVRFLQRVTDTGWEVAPPEAARDKVSHVLRTESKKLLKK